jgi:SAM-dependent methyltransferase
VPERDKRHAPSAERNRIPIGDALADLLPDRSLVLEIASGTGQHARYFGDRFAGWTWQTSEFDTSLFDSINAWLSGAKHANVRAPIALDVTDVPWPVRGHFDAVYTANMIHIAPWECALGLLQGAAVALAPGGILIIYGPFTFAGRHTTASNEAFDQQLRTQNPLWGVRDADVLEAEANALGLRLRKPIPMPSNNFLLIFETSSGN